MNICNGLFVVFVNGSVYNDKMLTYDDIKMLFVVIKSQLLLLIAGTA